MMNTSKQSMKDDHGSKQVELDPGYHENEGKRITETNPDGTNEHSNSKQTLRRTDEQTKRTDTSTHERNRVTETILRKTHKTNDLTRDKTLNRKISEKSLLLFLGGGTSAYVHNSQASPACRPLRRPLARSYVTKENFHHM